MSAEFWKNMGFLNITNKFKVPATGFYIGSVLLNTYINALITTAKNAEVITPIACAGNPNYPEAEAGTIFVVSTSGKIGGASGTPVLAGDIVICITDSAAGTQAEVGTKWQVVNQKITKQTAMSAPLTTITHTAPSSADYALQDLTDTGGFGFASKDEGNSLLAVVANLQTRVNELETKLAAVNIIAAR